MANSVEDGLEWLNEQLRLLGIDRAELARRGDFNAATLANIYSGKRKLGPKIAKSIARGLGAPEDVVFREFGLMGEKEDPDNEDEVRLFTELLNDIDDEEEKKKAVGLVTALLRQIAHTTRQDKSRAASKGAGRRSKAT